MSREQLFKILSTIDLVGTDFQIDVVAACAEDYVKTLGLLDDQQDLLKGLILVLASSNSLKNETLKVIKEGNKSAELSSSLLVDIDTRFELLFCHVIWLSENLKAQDFDLKLRSGARLAEEFFSDLVSSLSRIQRTIRAELGVGDAGLKQLVRNLNTVNDYLSELFGKLPNRYDALFASLISNS